MGEAEEAAWFIIDLNEDIRATGSGEGIDQEFKENCEIVHGSLLLMKARL